MVMGTFLLLLISKTEAGQACVRSKLKPSFTFTQEIARVELTPEQFKFTGSKNTSNAAYLKSLRQVAAGVSENVSSPLKRIVYFFSGSDSAAGFTIFPDAKVVIGASKTPFLPALPQGKFERMIARKAGIRYRHSVHVQTVPELAPELIAELAGSIPNFRLRKVSVIESKEANTWVSARRESAFHGIIDFDQGSGTPMRSYIHLNLNFHGERDYSQAWWMKQLREFSPDALLVKAAHDNYSGQKMAKFADGFLKLLRRSHSVLVEGVSKTGVSEFYLGAVKPVQTFPELNVRFGYSNTVRIHQF